MKLTHRLRVWRRRWCLWRGHPMADWSPVCITENGPARMVDGVIVPGETLTVRAWRCRKHDARLIDGTGGDSNG